MNQSEQPCARLLELLLSSKDRWQGSPGHGQGFLFSNQSMSKQVLFCRV